MKLTIQNTDYTAALDAAHPLTIERKLNEPSLCLLWLSLPSSGALAIPPRNASINVTGDDGTIYFTGYIAVTPLPEYVGFALEGPRYRIAIQALSDELLLDQLLMPPSAGNTGQAAGALMAALVTRTGSTALSTAGLSLGAIVPNFAPDPGAKWSESAQQVATQARAAYRAVNGALALAQAATTVHPLNETDGSLNLAALAFTASAKRALANDVTVCGQHEPVAYVTEYFLGDGVTTEFDLSADPFFLASSKSTIIDELFNEAEIDSRVWSIPDGDGYLALGPGGLVMNGGIGIDGDTVLSWLDQVEMGATLLLQAEGVSLSPGSTGTLAGFFTGTGASSNCIAGFQVTAESGSGAVSIQPLILGAPNGTIYPINPASQYTLRMRVNCPEIERELAIYRSFGDSGAITYGGQWIPAGAKLQMEVQEFVSGVGGTPVTLYDGSLANLAGAGLVVAASSINLIGAMRAFSLTSLGSGWVVSTPSGGTSYTRRIGTVAEAAECHIERTGKLAFYTGFAPPVGEQVAVSYRTIGRAVGRMVNTASQEALAAAGLPSTATWIGTATNPPARSSQDCRNAALCIEQAASGVSALWSGTYKGSRATFASDVWPGDALLLNAPSADLNAQVVVRAVKVIYTASYPDLFEYDIRFANDWADDLAIKTSSTVPADAWLPAAVNPTVLQNLNNLTVTTLNGTTVAVNTNLTPPAGGGFEVRRRDFAFMPGSDPGLVMRSTVPNFSWARENSADRFYIRTYDGSSPPDYSEFSTALFINLPLGS
jgi:hypothetical protein